jgi:hypothetical protein
MVTNRSGLFPMNGYCGLPWSRQSQVVSLEMWLVVFCQIALCGNKALVANLVAELT